MRRIISMVACALLALSACGTPAAPPSTDSDPASPTAEATGSTPQTTRDVSVGMGYIPDIQFAPFYVAQAKGYYADEGLNVTLNHGSIQDALLQVAQGRLNFGNASGDEILLARAQDIPITMVFQTFRQFPVAIFSKEQSGITQPSDLIGKTVGVPGRFGATYVGFLGVLYAAGIEQQEVNIAEIGFTQAEAVREDRVDAAVGYINNEPLLLQTEGIAVNVLPVADAISLVSNGIVTSEQLLADDPDLARRFVHATARGLQDTIEDPDEAFALALRFIPELSAEQQPRERQKLQETIELWRPQNETTTLGFSDSQQWQTTYQFLRESGLLQRELDVDQAFTNVLLADE